MVKDHDKAEQVEEQVVEEQVFEENKNPFIIEQVKKHMVEEQERTEQVEV